MKDGQRRVDLEKPGTKSVMEGASRSSGKLEVDPLRFSLEKLNEAELLEMLSLEHSTYSEEAIACAKLILKERGAKFIPYGFTEQQREDYLEQKEKDDAESRPSPASRTFGVIRLLMVLGGLSVMGKLISSLLRDALS